MEGAALVSVPKASVLVEDCLHSLMLTPNWVRCHALRSTLGVQYLQYVGTFIRYNYVCFSTYCYHLPQVQLSFVTNKRLVQKAAS